MGSSFLLNPEGIVIRNQSEFGSSTPEYLPPEIHNHLAKRFTLKRNSRVSDFANLSYIFDIWSLGSILLEILSGFPLWLSLKSRILTFEGNSITNVGLFGVAGRDNQKILTRQNQLLSGGMHSLLSVIKKGYDFTGNRWVTDPDFLDLMQ